MAEPSVNVLVKDIRRVFDLEPSDTIPAGTSMMLDHAAWVAPRRATPALVQAILSGSRMPLLELVEGEAPLPIVGSVVLYAEGGNVHAVTPDGTDYVMRAVGRSELAPVTLADLTDATEVLVAFPDSERPFLLTMGDLAGYLTNWQAGHAPEVDEITSWEP